MEKIKHLIAEKLLQIKAIKLNPANPFTWASGWKSPIYCDNRKTLSYPEVRNTIKNEFANIIKAQYPEVDVIAGVATGAIAIGALVADILDLPFVYVRSASKGHGLENLIEGVLETNQKVVVIEDLVSTGGSSIKAVEAIRKHGAEVMGMLAIFTYGFELSVNNFKSIDCKLTTLSDYHALLDIALQTNYIQQSELETLNEWRKKPESWKQD